MLRVGLTGGIATGKSTVGEMFVALGVRLIDADRIVHELLEPGQAVYAAVVREFGPGVLLPDGTIDRRSLGGIIFGDVSRREALNAIVHPVVIQRQREFVEDVARQDPDGIAMVDAALMIEVGTYKNYDALVVVTCPPEMQVQRLVERSGLTLEDARKRIQAQMSIEEKVRYADYVIDNSGSLANTKDQVAKVYSALRARAVRSSS